MFFDFEGVKDEQAQEHEQEIVDHLHQVAQKSGVGHLNVLSRYPKCNKTKRQIGGFQTE